jgi:hypothetical protein
VPYQDFVIVKWKGVLRRILVCTIASEMRCDRVLTVVISLKTNVMSGFFGSLLRWLT